MGHLRMFLEKRGGGEHSSSAVNFVRGSDTSGRNFATRRGSIPPACEDFGSEQRAPMTGTRIDFGTRQQGE
jgi:hypothetical protein